MKKEKSKILKEKYAGSFTGKRDEEQAPLFGDKDQLYNTIQEEISIVVAMIVSCQDSIDKKEEQIVVLKKRKDNLERAARTAAKMRDEELSKVTPAFLRKKK